VSRTARPPRRAATIWWAAGIAVCILAIAVAIRAAQNQSSPQADTAKHAVTNRPTVKPPRAGRPPGSPTPSPTVPSSLVGTWSGQVTQSYPYDVFSVQVTLSSSGGTVRYSGATFACSGDLSLVSSVASTVRLNQGIVQGHSCGNGLVTIIRGPANTLRFTFQGKGATPATGTLAR
jgi:hypothetical protein